MLRSIQVFKVDSFIAPVKFNTPGLFFGRQLYYTRGMNQVNYYYSVGLSEDDPVRQAEIKIKRSTFICSLAYVSSMEAAKAFITRVSKENKTATHNCWAYVVGDRGEISHASDAGEPAGTAGKPMLNVLAANHMTCVAAVVTRHYGGVKLGVRGLIDAYGRSVLAAIEQAPLVKLVKTRAVQVVLPYPFNDIFTSQIKSFRADIAGTEYGESVTHDLLVELVDADAMARFLNEYQDRGQLVHTWEDEE